MAVISNIPWLFDPHTGVQGASWNAWYGCRHVSPACSNCYIVRQAPLRIRGLKFTSVADGGSTVSPDGTSDIVMADRKAMFMPLRTAWRIGRLVFVASLSDLWHPHVPNATIAEMFAVMLLAPQHVYLLLTKRPVRQKHLLGSAKFADLVIAALHRIAAETGTDPGLLAAALQHFDNRGPNGHMLPLPNVWLGVTVECNDTRDRIQLLADTPAVTRWISAEPITDPNFDLGEGGLYNRCPACEGTGLPTNPGPGVLDYCTAPGCVNGMVDQPIDWVVLGGESGHPQKPTPQDLLLGIEAPGLRPLDLDHLRSLATNVTDIGAAKFVKQLGTPWALENGADSAKGEDPDEWPADLRVRDFPPALLAHHRLHGRELVGSHG